MDIDDFNDLTDSTTDIAGRVAALQAQVDTLTKDKAQADTWQAVREAEHDAVVFSLLAQQEENALLSAALYKKLTGYIKGRLDPGYSQHRLHEVLAATHICDDREAEIDAAIKRHTKQMSVAGFKAYQQRWYANLDPIFKATGAMCQKTIDRVPQTRMTEVYEFLAAQDKAADPLNLKVQAFRAKHPELFPSKRK